MNITTKQIDEAAIRLEGIVNKTPLQYSKRLSKKYDAKIFLKREDLQEVRSFKIRGAYNKIASLSENDRKKGVVCASAGNHAQGVAYSCSALKINGAIFMPVTTPTQKIDKVKHFGGKFAEVQLVGNTFDDCYKAAMEYCKKKKSVFVHPFNDPLTIAGQGTIGKEIYDAIFQQNNSDEAVEGLEKSVDPEKTIVIAAIGGGGLTSGVSSYLKQKNKGISVIGAEPEGAAAMYLSIKNNKLIALDAIDTFVDGAAVKQVGDLTFSICKKLVDKVLPVPEGLICSVMIELYQNEGIVTEPAGALSVSVLDLIKDKIKGKTVICILSGGNNDILRYPEIMERSLVYQGRKHYFIVEFAQKPGQLRNFVDKALGPTDDIVRFEYMKKTNKEKGPALIGIELRNKDDLMPLLIRMKEIELNYRILDTKDLLYQYLV